MPRDHGPAGRTPPEKNEAPELGLAASGWLLVVLNPEASLLWLISEVWCVRLYIMRLWSLVTTPPGVLFTLFTDTLACTVCILSSNY